MVLCELCGGNPDIEFSNGDEGCEVTCTKCGYVGLLYVSISEK